MSLLGTAARGALAGAAGTLAMDLVWYRRFRAGGGEGSFLDWDITREVESWDAAPAPAQVARKLLEAVSADEVPVSRAPLLTNVMHWAYGTQWAAQYALLVSRARGRRALWHGPAFGAGVWASDYVTLPLLGIYEPVWKEDVGVLWQDLSAHMVFGAASDAALRLLTR